MRNYDFLFSFILDVLFCDVRCRFNLIYKVFLKFEICMV